MASEAFDATCRTAFEKYKIPVQDLHNTIRKRCREIWYSLPQHDYAKIIGISSWEALWANFIGKHEKLKELNQIKDKYQFDSWNTALKDFDIDDPDFAHELKIQFQVERRKLHRLFPETTEILDHYKKKYRLGLITNGTPDLQWEKIKGAKVESYFEHIIISGEVDYGKPAGQIFDVTLSKFGVSAAHMVIIGNSMKSDIQGGNNAGLDTIWINRENEKPDEQYGKPDYIITNLCDLYKLL